MDNKFKIILKERWKFYLIGYLIGYIAPIINNGVPSWHYLFPIRLMAIACSLGLGTAFYYGSIGMPIFEIVRRGLKYILLIIIIFIFALIIQQSIIALTGYDILPLIGLVN